MIKRKEKFTKKIKIFFSKPQSVATYTPFYPSVPSSIGIGNELWLMLMYLKLISIQKIVESTPLVIVDTQWHLILFRLQIPTFVVFWTIETSNCIFCPSSVSIHILFNCLFSICSFLTTVPHGYIVHTISVSTLRKRLLSVVVNFRNDREYLRTRRDSINDSDT